jgi:hypothetical protein
LSFVVLNPGGRDAEQTFPDGAGSPRTPGHPPVNYHAYAACVRGGFYREAEAIPDGTGAVLLLLRRDLERCFRAVRDVQGRGMRAFVSWKESGAHQVAAALNDAQRIERFHAVCRTADGFIASTAWLAGVYRAAGCTRGEFIPTPYPVEEEAWDFSAPVEVRGGIFIGTREFDVPSRNHLEAILRACDLARRADCRVTCVNGDGARGSKMLKALRKEHGCIEVVEKRLAYPDYLRLMASHRLVFQLDGSRVPGQVAGDASLCRIPCVGGNGAIDEIIFPASCGTGRETDALIELAARLLESDADYRECVDENQQRARDTLSFGVIAERLRSIAGG